MRTIGNLLWFLMGGVLMGLGWWLVGLLAFVLIVASGQSLFRHRGVRLLAFRQGGC